jgi:hypothetical protein
VSTEPVIKDIDYLARQIVAQKPKCMFWLGAGVSATPGIPTVSGVVDRLLDRLWRKPGGAHSGDKSAEPYASLSEPGRAQRIAVVRPWVSANFPDVKNWCAARGTDNTSLDNTDWGAFYSTGLSLLPGEEDRQEFIVECFKEGRGRLNVAHLLMCQLMVSDFVRIALRTNFDDLLLRALHLYFEVPAALDPDSLATLMTSSAFLQVAYLHGKLSSYRQRHTNLDLHSSIPRFENFLTPTLKDHGLVVVGYRGGDEMPMSVLENVLQTRSAVPGRGLFWVSYEKDYGKLSEGAKRVLQFKDSYWLPGWDADIFFERLCACQGIGLGLPDPSDFSRRLAEILPEKARASWTIRHEPQLAPAGPAFDLSAQAAKEQEVPVSQTSRELTFSEFEHHPQDRSGLWDADTPGEAIILCEQALLDDPANAEAFQRWGSALSELGRHEEAVTKYQRAADLNPAHAETFAAWADALQALGRHEEAVEIYRRASDLDPKLESLFIDWGSSLQQLGRHEEAIEKFRPVPRKLTPIPRGRTSSGEVPCRTWADTRRPLRNSATPRNLIPTILGRSRSGAIRFSILVDTRKPLKSVVAQRRSTQIPRGRFCCGLTHGSRLGGVSKQKKNGSGMRS